MADIEISERRQGDTLILRPRGRIDALVSHAFQGRLLAALVSEDADCVVDFSAVEMISSAGLGALIRANRDKSPPRRLAVACPTGAVRDVFRISGFAHIMPIFATVEEAIAAQAPQPQPAPAPPSAQPANGPPPGFSGINGSLPESLSERQVRAKLRNASTTDDAPAPTPAPPIQPMSAARWGWLRRR